MENPLLSIITPVYNVAHYLPGCIESILAQQFTDFELILINDGSTDESGELCDRFAQRDTRIRVFHQDNRGLSGARN
ncbi:MAG: glycosyltransferase, partial [Bacteroidales bacterium]